MSAAKARLQEVLTVVVCLTAACAMWGAHCAWQVRRPAAVFVRFAGAAGLVVVMLRVGELLHLDPTGELIGVAFGVGSLGYVLARHAQAPQWAWWPLLVLGCLLGVGLLIALNQWASATSATVGVLLLAGAGGLVKHAAARQLRCRPCCGARCAAWSSPAPCSPSRPRPDAAVPLQGWGRGRSTSPDAGEQRRTVA